MTFAELLAAVRSGELHGRPISNVTDRSWEVRPGTVFVALSGQRTSGARFLPQATEQGAIAVVAQTRLDTGLPQCVVDDPATSLGQLCAAFCGEPSRRLRLIGVTGTNGKTTVTSMLAAVLGAAGRRTGQVGTLGVHVDGRKLRDLSLTTPTAPDLQATLKELYDHGVSDVVMEVSSHALRQRRTAGCEFDLAVFTNWTRDHTDYHGDMQRYLEAKALLFAGLSTQEKAATAVLNAASPAYTYLRQRTAVPIVSFGQAPDFFAANIDDHRLQGTSFDIVRSGASFPVQLRLPGTHNVENALATAAAASTLGVPMTTIARALGEMTKVEGRMHVLDIDQPYRVIIDYAHNPAGLARLLRLTRAATDGQLISVFGGRGERDRGKRPLMGAIAGAIADLVIITVDNPRSEDPAATAEEVASGVGDAGGRMLVEIDRYEAIRKALSLARAGDTVTISGKGPETWDEGPGDVAMTDELAVRQILGGVRQTRAN